MDERELRFDIFTSGINQLIGMRIVHMPTWTAVEGQGMSRIALRNNLMEELEKRVRDLREP